MTRPRIYGWIALAALIAVGIGRSDRIAASTTSVSRTADESAIATETENRVRTHGCVACHRAEGVTAERLAPLPAPDLHTIGKRLTPEYLREFLSKPHEVRPGTAMPDLLGRFSTEERAEVVEDLVHYLGTRGGLFRSVPEAARPLEMDRGGELFRTIGCLACHEDERAWRDELAGKTNLSHVVELLLKPEKLMPSGLMPSMRLSEEDARAIALYLLEDQSRDADGVSLIHEVPGLRESYYEGVFSNCSTDLERAEPIRVGVADQVGLPSGHREEYFGVVLEGEIEIPASGEWSFGLISDDGSRLWIDGDEVIDHDGLHGATLKLGQVTLESGWHEIRVSMYEYGGDQELKLLWEGPGVSQTEVPASAFRVRDAALQPRTEKLRASRDRRARGQAHYIHLGCAACHDRGMAPEGATPFASLPAKATGCLDASPPAGSRAPHFDWGSGEAESLIELLDQRSTFDRAASPERSIALSLDRLRCSQCHSRDGTGGPGERATLFTGTAELGDEGRIPPDLTGVGAKLQTDWFSKVLLQGASVRPYMVTRMPTYTDAAIGDLVSRFRTVDRAGRSEAKEPEFTPEVVQVGRQLTGGEGFRCIDCHDFAGYPSLGEPAVDLANSAERLEPDWYHEYMRDPQSKRPGTRMPAFWAEGLDLFPDLLEGSAAKQIDATWSYLSLGETAPLPVGLVVDRRLYDLVPVDEPILFGAFFRGLSARVICCGYPERISFAYDVENARLAKLWRGKFMNARGTWEGRAGKLETPEGSDPLDLPPGVGVAALTNRTDPWPTRPSRELNWLHRSVTRDAERRPIFRREHRPTGVSVEEWVTPRYFADQASLVRHVKVSGGDGSLVFRAFVGAEIESVEGEFRVEEGPRLRVRGAEGFVHSTSGGGAELRVAIPAGGATIEVEMEW